MTFEKDGDLESDWAQSYGVIPREFNNLPVYFVVDAKCTGMLRRWTFCLQAALKLCGCPNIEYHEIPEVNGMLVDADIEKLADEIQVWLDLEAENPRQRRDSSRSTTTDLCRETA